MTAKKANQPKTVTVEEPWPSPPEVAQWIVRMELGLINDKWQPAEIAVRRAPRQPSAPVTGAILRRLPITSLVERALTRDTPEAATVPADATRLFIGFTRSDTTDLADELRQSLATSAAVAGPGRRHDAAFFENVLAFYNSIEKISSRPAQILAAELGVNPSTARQWVTRARERAAREQAPDSTPS